MMREEGRKGTGCAVYVLQEGKTVSAGSLVWTLLGE